MQELVEVALATKSNNNIKLIEKVMGKRRVEMSYKDMMQAYNMVKTQIQAANIKKWHRHHFEELKKENKERSFYQGISHEEI